STGLERPGVKWSRCTAQPSVASQKVLLNWEALRQRHVGRSRSDEARRSEVPRRSSGGAPPRPPSRAPARRVYHPDRPSSPRCPMVATDSTLSFPDRRVAERRGLPSRRSGLDRRDHSISVPLERRGGGERRRVADPRSWTERPRASAEAPPVP